jgi:hypothetical protein
MAETSMSKQPTIVRMAFSEPLAAAMAQLELVLELDDGIVRSVRFEPLALEPVPMQSKRGSHG